jgi:hypothetical protein
MSAQWKEALAKSVNPDGTSDIRCYLDPRGVEYAPIAGTETYYTNTSADQVLGEFSLSRSTVNVPFDFTYPITFECMVKPGWAYDTAVNVEFCKFYSDIYDTPKVTLFYSAATDQIGAYIYQNLAGGGGAAITSVTAKLAKVYTSNAMLQQWIRLTVVITASAVTIYANGNGAVSSAVTMSGIRKCQRFSPGNDSLSYINYVLIYPGLAATAAQICSYYNNVKNESVFFDFQQKVLGRTRCDVTEYLRSYNWQAIDGYRASTASVSFQTKNGELADDQYAIYAPESGSYNGLTQKYMTQSLGLSLAYKSKQKAQINNTGARELYWSFDEGSTATCYDSSGNGLHGTLANTPTVLTVGKHGKGISFDGVNEAVSITDLRQLTTNNDITISAYIYIPSSWTWDTTNQSYLFGIGSSTGSIGIVQYTTDNRICAGIRDTTAVRLGGVSLITRDRWYHVAVVYNGTTRTGQLYIDGVSSGAAFAQANTGENFDRIVSGGGIYAISGTASYIEMSLDECFIDSKIWTQAQLASYVAGINGEGYSLTTDASDEPFFYGTIDRGGFTRTTSYNTTSTFSANADDLIKRIARKKVRSSRTWADYYLSRATPVSNSLWHEYVKLATDKETYNYFGNSSFEKDTIANSWLSGGVGASFTRSDAISLDGTYSGRLLGTSGLYFLQSAAMSVSPGNILTFQVYGWSAVAETCTIYLEEYAGAVLVDATSSVISHPGNGWQLLSVTHTVTGTTTTSMMGTVIISGTYLYADMAMLTYGGVKYFYVENANDGTAGTISESLAHVGTYSLLGSVAEDADIQHDWSVIKRGESPWEKIKALCDACLARFMHISPAGVLHFASYLATADETTSRGDIGNIYGLGKENQPIIANRITVEGVYIDVRGYPQIVWTADGSSVGNESTDGSTFTVSLADDEYYPDNTILPGGIECLYEDRKPGA